jgi:pimeloyl-ACP methyl ester carboxylesterase
MNIGTSVGVRLLVVALPCFYATANGQTPFNAASPRSPAALRVPRALSAPGPFLPGSPGVRLPAQPAGSVTWIPCQPDAQALGATCGELPVPLDRQRPQGAKIRIYFEIYFHTDPGPAVSAILANPGGPGGGTTPLRAAALTLFAQNLDVHDLLLIDDRGRGLSQAIDCEELQHGTAPFHQAEADCTDQLGQANSFYGTGDVAMDTEAVRTALGYDKVDYWAVSYGGEDVTAYATRFGEHLRSIVLDAPEGVPALQPFVLGGDSARATLREVRLDCLRSPTCAADHPNPDAEFANLIDAVRHTPIKGYAHNANGELVGVRVDEAALLYLAITYPAGRFVALGELLAAGKAWSLGDPVPLLRLGAEVAPFITDYGDPGSQSQGDYFATLCTDAHQPWDWSEPASERSAQFAAAVSHLPADYYAPFSIAAGTSLTVSPEAQCLGWQKPTPAAPVAPPHARYPQVPTLVMDGDLDALVPEEEVRQVAALFPGSLFIRVAEAGHGTISWSACAAALQSQFLETMHVTDASCAQTPETIWPALGRFPRTAANAHPAEIDAGGANQIGDAERKVVTVAVATALDALKRSTIDSGSGVGLRAGTFQTSFDGSGNQTTTLTDCAFATDVLVSGAVFWGSDLSLVADLTVSGSGTGGGTLHLRGTWQAPGPVGKFTVSGTLGGRKVAVLIPEA